MTKQELIEKLKELDLEYMSCATRDASMIMRGLQIAIELAEQLDEPRECKIITCAYDTSPIATKHYRCDLCNGDMKKQVGWNFCPNCGAKIKRGAE